MTLFYFKIVGLRTWPTFKNILSYKACDVCIVFVPICINLYLERPYDGSSIEKLLSCRILIEGEIALWNFKKLCELNNK
jgi:hypothetical protein